jgi:hypothetical protein
MAHRIICLSLGRFLGDDSFCVHLIGFLNSMSNFLKPIVMYWRVCHATAGQVNGNWAELAGGCGSGDGANLLENFARLRLVLLAMRRWLMGGVIADRPILMTPDG